MYWLFTCENEKKWNFYYINEAFHLYNEELSMKPIHCMNKSTKNSQKYQKLKKEVKTWEGSNNQEKLLHLSGEAWISDCL